MDMSAPLAAEADGRGGGGIVPSCGSKYARRAFAVELMMIVCLSPSRERKKSRPILKRLFNQGEYTGHTPIGLSREIQSALKRE